MVYFVSTPIGNLKDVTLRALETLRAADVIFCEDTRHSLTLLNAYDIRKPLHSCHKFNEREAAGKVIAAAAEGKEVAYVTDAGTPCVSDPGNVLCAELRKAGVPYTVVPGADAAIPALVLSGFDSSRFTFLGFLPEKASARERLLSSYRGRGETLIFYCAPQDVDRDVRDMAAGLGDRRACAVREITKIHEEAVFFDLSDGLPGEKRGEYVIVVEGAEEECPLNSLSERDHILHYMDEGLDKKEAVKRAARDRGLTKSEMYRFAIDL